MRETPLQLYTRLEREQRAWIEKCEKGDSYRGPNGPAIRDADLLELDRITSRLRSLTAHNRRPTGD